MGDDATRRRAAWLVATPLLLVVAALARRWATFLLLPTRPHRRDLRPPRSPRAGVAGAVVVAIVLGDGGEITDRAAEATDQALRRDGCLELVTHRALLHRWPGYPRDLPIPAHGKYRPVVDIYRPIPQSAGRSPRAPARATWR